MSESDWQWIGRWIQEGRSEEEIAEAWKMIFRRGQKTKNFFFGNGCVLVGIYPSWVTQKDKNFILWIVALGDTEIPHEVGELGDEDASRYIEYVAPVRMVFPTVEQAVRVLDSFYPKGIPTGYDVDSLMERYADYLTTPPTAK